MEKLNVKVGYVFTQVMFCDDQGKLHFHQVMTDVDKPWESVKEVLMMVKQALCMDKPKGYYRLIQSVTVDLQYKKVNFSSLLETLREEMEFYLSEGCQVSIRTIMEHNFVEEVVPVVAAEEEDARHFATEARSIDVQPAVVSTDLEPVLSHYRECPVPMMEEEHVPAMECRPEIASFVAEQASGIFADGKIYGWETLHDLRGSPLAEEAKSVWIYHDG